MSVQPEPSRFAINPVPYVVTIAGVIAALYYGQAIFRPFTLAILFAVFLTASADALTRVEIAGFRLRKWMAMVISISLFIFGLYLIAQILAGQANDVQTAWPRYVKRFEVIIGNLAEWLNADIASQVKQRVAELDLSSSITAIASRTGSILADMIMTGLYAAFILASRGQFVKKIAVLFPNEKDHQDVSHMLKAASRSTRKYLLIKTIVSMFTGLISYTILKLVGVDFAETWALLIFLLNYIPTIGSIVGVVFPAVLALVQFDSFGPFLIIAVLLTATQFTIGNIIEPIFMGKVLNLSSLVVLMALAFWGILWGITGMLMSVPLTVVFMILCAHIPKLRWIAVLLSEDGKLHLEKDKA
ncbi:MAG: AI-2E family transporter [Hyphomicrobiales bacterium]